MLTHALDRAATLCEAIATLDFGPAGSACYVVPFSRVRHLSERLACGACFAWTSITLDLTLQPWLESVGEWRGRGFATIVRDDVLRTAADILDVVLHELAHGIEHASAPAASMQLADLPAMLRMPVAELPAEWAGTIQSEPAQGKPWAKHGHRFIRAAAHVCWRARSQGYVTTLKNMHVAGTGYGVSPARSYELALGDEPRDCENESIGEVLKRSAPLPFQQLWTKDTGEA